MKNHLLLPNKCRLIGYVLLPFAMTWLVLTSFCEVTVFDSLRINQGGTNSSGLFSGSGEFLWSKNFSADLNGTIAITMTLLFLFMVAFAKEKKEDEYVRMVRLRALQVSVYVNYVILLLTTIFIYSTSYLLVIEINLFTIPIIFILVYNYFLHIRPRLIKSDDL